MPTTRATPPRRRAGGGGHRRGLTHLRPREFSRKDGWRRSACDTVTTGRRPRPRGLHNPSDAAAALGARHTRCHASPSRCLRSILPLCAPGARGQAPTAPAPRACQRRKVPPGLNPRRLRAHSVSPVRNQGDRVLTPARPEGSTPRCASGHAGSAQSLCRGQGDPPTVPEHSKALLPRGPRPTVLAGASSLRGTFVKRPTPYETPFG